MSMKHQYGLIPQKQDMRDKLYAIRIQRTEIPAKVDLRPNCPPVFDQGNIGSCTANAGVAARMMLEPGLITDYSRLFLYYKERELENTIGQDAGAEMRDVGKTLLKFGVCEESYHPYIESNFTVAPNNAACANALDHRITSYNGFDNDNDPNDLLQIKTYIATRKQPVLIGMYIYESFESDEVAKTGIMPMPNAAKEQCFGGHAVLIVGYDDERSALIVRNSWGTDWGMGGYFYMPYDYVTTHCAFDSWVLTL